jgi:hypothetical protein
MTRLVFIGLSLVLNTSIVWANSAPVVSNVLARQRPGTTLVDITYDVTDADGDLLIITLQMSDDGGRTFRVQATSLEGDFGFAIEPGVGKRIEWDAGADVPDTYGTDFRPKIIADDGQVTPPPSGGGGGEPLRVTLPGGETMDFIWIEPGTFTMGSPTSEPNRGSDETQHEVTISQGFYLGQFELTQAQWQSVMETQPWSGQTYTRVDPTHPAVHISWNDIQTAIPGEGCSISGIVPSDSFTQRRA